MKQEVWEKEYRNVDNLWGFTPNNILLKYIDLVPKGGKVLDVGIGEGRNALFFAKQGFVVQGIDISETAINRCLDLSKEHNLKIVAKVDDIRNYEVKKDQYSLIILSNVLNFFPDHEISEIIAKLKNGLKENGLIYINVFDNEEPSLTKAKERCKQIADFTYYDEKNEMYHHYFTQDELKNLVAEHETISLVKSRFLDMTHGQPHYHSTLEILSKKTNEYIP
ncbi:class I SAM-dependent methyltransferase [Ureibacillus acetophenoni]|uniref:Methyltransferase family protein n=1 Tax=Ureibacillus acetophenoni TaxID=614649 RepID=A0A285UPI5_9BACL|nr:class I SAM-dependent methyltransferase [Ureibacillus acetophenoni]SOC43794.1 methyltransferase family protein [Ureibacillus acetophenoni]